MTIIQAQPLRTYGISGPASALDNEVPVFDGVTGKKVKAGTGLIITTNLMQAANKAVLLSGTTGGTPASGGGTRMMWIPAKGAFRAGYVYSDRWDDANIGVESLAFGYNGIASGSQATHFGRSGVASGQYSAHFGLSGTASGAYSTHFGREGTISNSYSTHFGREGEVGGYASAHFGQYGVVNGGNAVHFGVYGKANGDYSFVGGKYMQLSAAADNSFAFGHHTSAVALTQPNTFYIFPSGTAGKVAIGTTVAAVSAIVDITSTVGALLLPRMTTAQKNALTGSNGMLLYDNTLNKFQGYENGAWANLI